MTDESKATGNQPVDLLELITYQKKSVVSRQILKRKSGTITLFAFDKDEGLSEHTAPFEAFIFIPQLFLKAQHLKLNSVAP